MSTTLERFWGEIVPRHVLNEIGAAYCRDLWQGRYWGSYREEAPEEHEVIEQIAVDCAGTAFDYLVGAIPRDLVATVAEHMPNGIKDASKQGAAKLRKLIQASLEDSTIPLVVGAAKISDENIRKILSALVKDEPLIDTLSRADLLSRIESECNRHGVIRFISQPIFKESEIQRWLKDCKIEVASTSRKAQSEKFYDDLIKRMRTAAPRSPPKTTSHTHDSPLKRNRDEEKAEKEGEDKEESGAKPRPKKQRLAEGDVEKILGMCKPESGLERPLHWKVALKNGKEAVLTSHDMIERGPYLLVEYFENRIVGYLESQKK